MFKVIQILILGALVAVLASWLSQAEGTARVDWLGYRIELSTSLLVLMVGILLILVIMLDRTWRAIKLWPRLLGAGWVQRRKQNGETALGLGLVALAAGDVRSARRQARKAERLLGRGTLPDLLAAQSAHALGDTHAAHGYFAALAAAKDTAYFGQLGLMQLYHLRGDETAAVAAARKALRLQPDSRAAGQFLLTRHVAMKNWQAAAQNVQMLLSDRYLETDDKQRYQRQLACLDYLQLSESTERADNPEGADRPAGQDPIAEAKQRSAALGQVLAHDAHFLPAVIDKAACDLQAGQTKRSLKALEAQYLHQPHSDLVLLIQKASGDNSGQLIARLTKLSGKAERAAEARMVAAKAALDCGIWASASNLLSQIAPEDHTNHYFLMQAELARIAETPEEEAAAMQRAAHAPHGPAWQCDHCQLITPQFEAVCPDCGAVGSIDWRLARARQTQKALPVE